ncbi:MAG: aminotransferase class III-fold pyridoxal phosphate-dependent enzyme, partial [Rhodospirillales bacterium]|nr:aminotransferase class III-fold pyridoxal phosphate-dependent enzyme [Rhodospirillales bacterium]
MSIFNTPQGQHGHNRLNDAVADVFERYNAANPKSHERWQQSKDVMPGGNTRTVLHYDPFPLTMVKGEGPYLHDLDGHKYTDFLGEYSAGLYGHSHPILIKAIKDAIDEGMVLGAPNQWEAKLAGVICERFPS